MTTYCNPGERVTVTMGPDQNDELVVYTDNRGPLDVMVTPLGGQQQVNGQPYLYEYDVQAYRWDLIFPDSYVGGDGSLIINSYNGAYWELNPFTTGTYGGIGYAPITGPFLQIDSSNPTYPAGQFYVTHYNLERTYDAQTETFSQVLTGPHKTIGPDVTYSRYEFTISENGGALIPTLNSDTFYYGTASGLRLTPYGWMPDEGGGGAGNGERVTITKGGIQVFTRDFPNGANVSVTCGDDCRDDEVKVWINRSDNRFMCCKCHC